MSEKQYERMFAVAVRALNKLDDHFEYKNESKVDRFFVRGVLDKFSEGIDNLKLPSSDELSCGLCDKKPTKLHLVPNDDFTPMKSLSELWGYKSNE